MEDLAPPLVLLWDVRRSLERGQSVGAGIKSYLANIEDYRRNKFRNQVENWWAAQNNDQISFDSSGMSEKRKYLLEILETGLRGNGILPALLSAEDELMLSCEDEILAHVAWLPIFSLIPLLFFVFPALMIVLLSPLIELLQI